MKRIPLTGKKFAGQFAVVDDEDFDLVSQWKWFCAGDERTKYAVRTQWSKTVDSETGEIITKWSKIRMHHLIVVPSPGMEVDHINGDGLDNRRENLRECTHAENMRNRKRLVTNSSGFMGVQQSGKLSYPWRATIGYNGRLIMLGEFADPVEAARARDAAAVEYYGEYANLNFPSQERVEVDRIVADVDWKHHRLSDRSRSYFKTPLYWAWNHMKDRCRNPNGKDWPNYGGRGITVCERWTSFDNFVEDMADDWVSGVSTLERIDSNGNYEPSNVRWATKSEQGSNTSRVKRIEYRGRTQNVSAWIRELGIARSAVYAHVRDGKTYPEAFDAVLGSREHIGAAKITFNGESLTAVEWAERLGLNASTIHARMRKSWPVEKVLSSERFNDWRKKGF